MLTYLSLLGELSPVFVLVMQLSHSFLLSTSVELFNCVYS